MPNPAEIIRQDNNDNPVEISGNESAIAQRSIASEEPLPRSAVVFQSSREKVHKELHYKLDASYERDPVESVDMASFLS